jgi:hypothetical protein
MAADNPPVVLALGPGVDLRKMRLDQRPLRIVQRASFSQKLSAMIRALLGA